MTLDEGTLKASEKIRRSNRERARRAAWIKFAAGALDGIISQFRNTTTDRHKEACEEAGNYADSMLTELSERDFTDHIPGGDE